MADYKMEAAEKACQLIQANQSIGLGDGTTILYLVQLIAADKALASTLSFASSSTKTIHRLKELDLTIQSLSDLNHLDLYFDGCDQFDQELNALKSGSGIHTMEKIAASMATEFILLGDSTKYVARLSHQYPIVVEIIPAALATIQARLSGSYQAARINIRDHVNDRGNYLLELTLDPLPELKLLNTFIKMLPGVVDHSLFYHMATKAIIAGPAGIKEITPSV
jgi:ribose 5-phosphate isomerase A